MRLDCQGRSNRVRRTLAAGVAAFAVCLAGCATVTSYELPNGKTAYEAQCSLWFQCTEQARKMCPHGYRLVRGPLRPPMPLSNGNRAQGPSRMDFICK